VYVHRNFFARPPMAHGGSRCSFGHLVLAWVRAQAQRSHRHRRHASDSASSHPRQQQVLDVWTGPYAALARAPVEIPVHLSGPSCVPSGGCWLGALVRGTDSAMLSVRCQGNNSSAQCRCARPSIPSKGGHVGTRWGPFFMGPPGSGGHACQRKQHSWVCSSGSGEFSIACSSGYASGR